MHKLAAHIHASVSGVREVYVGLGSQIGAPIDQPTIASAQLILDLGRALADVQPGVDLALSSAPGRLEAGTEANHGEPRTRNDAARKAGGFRRKCRRLWQAWQNGNSSRFAVARAIHRRTRYAQRSAIGAKR